MSINTETPRLSIITVCRNEVSRIQATMDSIIGQSCLSFEWIVVDGASTDGTLDILQRHKNHITRLISEPDQGLYEAMNKGIAAAKGDFLLFMNAGDCLENTEVVRSFLGNAFTNDLIVGDIRIILKDGRELYRHSTDKKLDADLLYWRTLPHQATFIKRNLFEKFGDYDLSFKLASDWEFFARVIARHGVRPSAWSHCIAVYPHDGISARLENRPQITLERNRIRKTHYSCRYRWRRAFNESWGSLIHWFRLRLSK